MHLIDQTGDVMETLTIAFLGDICGAPGRKVVQQQLPKLRAEHSPDIVIANAENARSGSGLSPDLYRKIRSYGIDVITLGDHVYRDIQIAPILEAMRPDFTEVETAIAILEAAQRAHWGPIQHAGKLHDRASYRYYWTLLKRARATGLSLPASAVKTFFAS